MSDWINTEERLPVEGDRIITYCKRQDMVRPAYYINSKFVAYFGMTIVELQGGPITDWMPLPEPPVKENA